MRLPNLPLLILLLALAACATQDRSLRHQSLGKQGGRGLPATLLVIAPDVRVSEISAGGVVEEVPDWTRQANGHLRASLDSIARELEVRTLDPPRLPADQQEMLDQHMALYDLVAGNAFRAGGDGDPAWAHKKRDFDYTLGPGLAFLPDQSGADAALFIVGADHISSGGRKAAMVFGAVFGVIIPGGVSYLTAGVVDLKSGDLLWLNYASNPATDLRQAKDADALLRQVFSTYPGRAGREDGR